MEMSPFPWLYQWHLKPIDRKITGILDLPSAKAIDPHVTSVAILKVVADVALDPWAKNKKEMKWKVVFCLLLKAKNTYIHLHTYICKKKKEKRK